MKPLRLVLCTLALTGCSELTTSPQPADEKDVVVEREEAIARSVEDIPASNGKAEKAANGPGERYLPLADWLVQRRSACNQEWDSIQNQLRRYQERLSNIDPAPEQNAEVAYAYTLLKALMLATCSPARTPGILNNLLETTSEYDWPPEYRALFDLLKSKSAAYMLLEEKYRDLEARHQKTIDGIGNIEQSLESEN
jgi:hypothetical protein